MSNIPACFIIVINIKNRMRNNYSDEEDQSQNNGRKHTYGQPQRNENGTFSNSKKDHRRNQRHDDSYGEEDNGFEGNGDSPYKNKKSPGDFKMKQYKDKSYYKGLHEDYRNVTQNNENVKIFFQNLMQWDHNE